MSAFEFRPKLMMRGHTCCSDQVRKGMQIAAKDNNYEMVESFLRCPGMDVNHGYGSQRTPLYIASRENHTRVVEILLADAGTDVNQEVNGENALIAATDRGYLKVVEILVNHSEIDTNIGKRGSQGSPLFLASVKGYSDIVKILLKQPQIEGNAAFGHLKRDHAHMMSAILFLLLLDPPCPRLATDLYYKIHAASVTLSPIWGPPSSSHPPWTSSVYAPTGLP